MLRFLAFVAVTVALDDGGVGARGGDDAPNAEFFVPPSNGHELAGISTARAGGSTGLEERLVGEDQQGDGAILDITIKCMLVHGLEVLGQRYIFALTYA